MGKIDFSNLSLKDFDLSNNDYERMGQYAKVLKSVDKSLVEDYGQMIETLPSLLKKRFRFVFNSLSILVLEVRPLGFIIFAKLDDNEVCKLEFEMDIVDDEEANKDAVSLTIDNGSECVCNLVVRKLLAISYHNKRRVYKVTKDMSFEHLSTTNLVNGEKVIAPKIGMTPWIKVC